MITTLLGRVALVLIAVLSIKILTTILAPDEIAKVALITAVLSLFSLVFVNPIGMYINRRFHEWIACKKFGNYFSIYLIYLVIISILSSFISFSLYEIGWFGFELSSYIFAALVACSIFFSTANQTLVPAFNMLGQHVEYVLLSIGTLVCSLFISYMFVTTIQPTGEGWVFGALVGQATFGVIAYRLFFLRNPQDRAGFLELHRILSGRNILNVFSYSWPVLISAVLGWVLMQGYRFYVADEVGLVNFGFFFVGYSLAVSLTSASEQVFTTWFQPIFYNQANSKSEIIRANAWSEYAKLMLPAAVLTTTALVAVADNLTVLLLGDLYQHVGIYIKLGAIAELGRVTLSTFFLVAHLRMNTRLLILPNAIGAAASIVLILILLRFYGLWIVPLSLALGSFLASLVIYFTAKTPFVNTELPLRKISISLFSTIPLSILFDYINNLLIIDGFIFNLISVLTAAFIWLPIFYFLVMRDAILHSRAARYS